MLEQKIKKKPKDGEIYEKAKNVRMSFDYDICELNLHSWSHQQQQTFTSHGYYDIVVDI